MFYTYILYSPTIKKFYIGNTSNIEQRIHYHTSGRSPFTRNKGPWGLVYSETYQTKQQALIRERKLKRWKSSQRIIEELAIHIDNSGSSVPLVTG
jgi:putative endonuclease